MDDNPQNMHPLEWDEDGHPVSTRFGDRFYSSQDGQARARHVFVAGNDLPARWAARPYFSIAELGFGTGLNFLETWRTWRATRPFAAQLSFTGFEAFPLSLDQMQRALSRWSDLAGLAERLLDALPSSWPPAGEERPIRLDRQTQLVVVIGDARETVAQWPGKADSWYLDGFSPALNPEMWNEELMKAVARATTPNGTFATYTAAEFVRRNLEAARFATELRMGYAGRRDMLAGIKRN